MRMWLIEVPLSLIGLIFLLLCACDFGNSDLQIPENDLVNIIADLHIAEVMVTSKKVPRDSLVYYKKINLEKIAYIHGYSSQMITDDIESLQKMPRKIKPIYEKVDRRLQELKDKPSKENEDAEKGEQDLNSRR